MGSTRDRRTRQEFALLQCGEFFRDELMFGGALTPRQHEKATELRALCFDALGEPSLADADEIRARHTELAARGSAGAAG